MCTRCCRLFRDIGSVSCESLLSMSRGEMPAKAAWMPPPNISKAVGGAFAEQGCEVHYTAGEADREIASYCVHRGCAAVLGKDSVSALGWGMECALTASEFALFDCDGCSPPRRPPPSP